MILNAKQILKLLGSAFAFIGVGFIIQRLIQYSASVSFSQFSYQDWLFLSCLTLGYALANFLLGLAWWNGLSHFNVHSSKGWAIKTFGLSQLGKYIPGNIFHLAGRQAIGMASGLPAVPLAKSAAWELGLLALAGAQFSVLTLPLLIRTLSPVASISIFVILVTLSTSVVKKMLSIELAKSLILYIVFLGCSGYLFSLTISLTLTDSAFNNSNLFQIIGAYVIAWLIGLITPGAPAGAGIRELVLMFFFTNHIAEEHLILAVLLGRIITIGGDLLFYLIALKIPAHATRQPNEIGNQQ